MSTSNREVEVKIAVPNAAAARKAIRSAGFVIHVPRVFEANVLYDTPGQSLRGQGKLVRLREAGKSFKLTYKGRSQDSRHKIREELETNLDKPEVMRRVFEEIGLTPVFRYEKYRTEFSAPGAKGVITLDETPIGTFLEIEGPPRWIDRTAKQLGFGPEGYITDSYGALYLKYCREHNIRPANMVFAR